MSDISSPNGRECNVGPLHRGCFVVCSVGAWKGPPKEHIGKKNIPFGAASYEIWWNYNLITSIRNSLQLSYGHSYSVQVQSCVEAAGESSAGSHDVRKTTKFELPITPSFDCIEAMYLSFHVVMLNGYAGCMFWMFSIHVHCVLWSECSMPLNGVYVSIENCKQSQVQRTNICKQSQVHGTKDKTSASDGSLLNHLLVEPGDFFQMMWRCTHVFTTLCRQTLLMQFLRAHVETSWAWQERWW